MKEIRIHGRGGQGAVVAAKLLADAAAKSGFQVQSFAAYGSERRGGKVESYVRISKEPVLVHSKMYEPDYVVMMDQGLTEEHETVSGVKEGGEVLINSPNTPEAFSSLGNVRIVTIDARRIATNNGVLLPNGMPVINTTIIGALVGMLPQVEIDSLIQAISEGEIPAADKNINAAKEAYHSVVSEKAAGVVVKEEVPKIFVEWHPVYREKMTPCEAHCPAGHAIHKTISSIQENRFEEALENIKAENPFPGICGRVCFHPCESHCNANEFDQGIAINALERAAFDHADTNVGGKHRKKEKTRKKVAVIGSGPAGMTCAYFLAILGHDVTVFEALPLPGGIPRVGIPAYRLPKDVVDREIEQIIELGIDLRTNTRVGKDIDFKDILEKYDICFVATGANRSVKLNIPGEDSEGVIPGLDFLKRVALGNIVDLGTRVAVLGGGDTAVDAARTSKRLGAKKVTIIYRRSIKEMPAHLEELEEAEEEGIKILYMTAPIKIHCSGSRADKLECIKTRLGDRDADGRCRPEIVEGTNFMIEVDNIITAIGETLEISFLPGDIEMNGLLIKVDHLGRTSIPGVYAGGDATNFSWNVAEAIGSGKRAALGIDIFLREGEANLAAEADEETKNSPVSMAGYMKGDYPFKDSSIVSFTDLNTHYFSKRPRAKVSKLSIPDRDRNFDEVMPGLSKDEAVAEAKRCFHCGHCNLCGNCFIFCPDTAIAFDESISSLAINHSLCKGCGICINECPRAAIAWEGGGE